jgi:hypothetical protein
MVNQNATGAKRKTNTITTATKTVTAFVLRLMPQRVSSWGVKFYS